VNHNKLWKILKRIRILDYLTCLLRNLYAGPEAIVRTDMKQQTGSKLGKESICVKTIYCHPAYLTFMQRHLAGIWRQVCGWVFMSTSSKVSTSSASSTKTHFEQSQANTPDSYCVVVSVLCHTFVHKSLHK